ncbi:Acetyl-coenzyme A synthetase [Spraguea lophii 42_110]|uniref:acetate--CoA ligase n=1 Tax=Spraguea lophii (strain 42_110) TaxID=1358809 RepID=S7XJ36_SPRLO|nr:Acetyl-coenzyme A synthetase [Spraguea lophii 42_110]
MFGLPELMNFSYKKFKSKYLDECLKNDSYNLDSMELRRRLDKFWYFFVDILHWYKRPTISSSGNFSDIKYFEDGILNACYNCVDRHPQDNVGLIYQQEDESVREYSYGEMKREISKMSRIFLECMNEYNFYINKFNINANINNNSYIHANDKEDMINTTAVTIYMPMIPSTIFTSLACSRIGYVHNVVFGGYSAESLRLRLIDSKSKILVTVLQYNRGNKDLDFIKTVKDSIEGTDVTNIIIIDEYDNKKYYLDEEYVKYFKERNINVILVSEYIKNINMNEIVSCRPVNAEHPLFYLYTSGSTGKPKGIIHTTGGYLLYVMLTTRYCFNVTNPGYKNDNTNKSTNGSCCDNKNKCKSNKNNNNQHSNSSNCCDSNMKNNYNKDVYCCTADLGWITGHSYTMYGPMLLGVPTVVVGGVLTIEKNRVFRMIEKLKITHFYTAPTLIRMLRELLSGSNNNFNYNISTLRIIGSVGEPISEDAYKWYSTTFNNLQVIDTYWQTEAGGIMISPIDKESIIKPECASLPFIGMIPKIVKLQEIFESDSTINLSTVSKDNESDNDNNLNDSKLNESGNKNDNDGNNLNKNDGNNSDSITTINSGIITDTDNKNGIEIGYNSKKEYIECKPYELGYLIFTVPWPSIARTILNDKERYIKSYFSFPEKKNNNILSEEVYFAGDKAYYDDDGYFWIRGRVDDVLNVSGHRLSTAEIESAAMQDNNVNEAAVVGVEDKITGQSIVLFICVNKISDNNYSKYVEDIKKNVINSIRKNIGPIIRIKTIYVVKELPKTSTGKLMRRVLRNILNNKEQEDISTCMNPLSIENIVNVVNNV